LDTVSANIELDNESDNAEVGRAVALARKIYHDFTLSLIAHTPKAVKRANVRDMSSRGAGAWEADVQGAFYMFRDEETDDRYIYGGDGVKRRDGGLLREIRVTGTRHTDVRTDRFGRDQYVGYLSIVLEPSSATERNERKEQAKSEAHSKKQDDIFAWLMRVLKDADAARLGDPASEDGYLSRAYLTADGRDGNPRDDVRAAINSAIENGVVQEVDMNQETRKKIGATRTGPRNYLELCEK
jgi:hypothetical protein